MTTVNEQLNRQTYHALVKNRVLFWCIWCWPIGVVAFGISFLVIAGFIPPPSPSWTAQEFADFIARDVTRIRIGIIGALFSTALFLPFFAIISAEIRKIEGNPSLLAPMQYGGAVILITIFQILGLAWLTATFRQEISPEISRALNDYCWMAWTTLNPTFVIQFVCIAIAGLMDKRPQPLWPRWAAYMNLWIAVTGVGGELAVFFKHGPFAWNGLIGFWIPAAVFMGGMCVTAVLLYRRFKVEEGCPINPDNALT